MHSRVYDTRFLAEYLYSSDLDFKRRANVEKANHERFISAITVHELYRVTLSREGRETAKLRIALVRQGFKVIPVDAKVAQLSAELRKKYQLSMGDSMIAATAAMLDAVCVSDDPHFKTVKEIHTAWV